MLGFRGHFATKSRSYSVTFTVLRERRAQFNALLQHVSLGLSVGADSVLVVNDWRYAGRGIVADADGASITCAPPGACPVKPTSVAQEEAADVG
jgi:hypothetical protein